MDDYLEPATHIQVEDDYGIISDTSAYEDYAYDGPAEVEEEPPRPIDVYTTISEISNGKISLTTSFDASDSKYDTINTCTTEMGVLDNISNLQKQQNGLHNGGYEKTSHFSTAPHTEHIYSQTTSNQQNEEEEEEDEDEQSVDEEAEEVFRAVSGHSCTSETGDEKIPSNVNGKIVCGRNKVLLLMVLICVCVLGIFALMYVLTTTEVGWKKGTKNSTATNSTTVSPLSYCMTATNFTRAWRMDHNGSDIRPGFGKHSDFGYACDLHEDLQWFRFTGDAGNKMLDSCPLYESCGATYPFWTDAEMPQEVGVEEYITAYGVFEDDCRNWSKTLLVIRCSQETDHDFIYKYIGDYEETCYSAFCGMT